MFPVRLFIIVSLVFFLLRILFVAKRTCGSRNFRFSDPCGPVLSFCSAVSLCVRRVCLCLCVLVCLFLSVWLVATVSCLETGRGSQAAGQTPDQPRFLRSLSFHCVCLLTRRSSDMGEAIEDPTDECAPTSAGGRLCVCIPFLSVMWLFRVGAVLGAPLLIVTVFGDEGLNQ